MKTIAIPHSFDLISLLLSVVFFSAYNLFIWQRLRRNPIYTLQGAAVQARQAWVVHVMEEKKDILAVQTLRNSTMAATFLASTAILLSVGIMTLTGQTENLTQTWATISFIRSATHSTLALKLLVLIANLFIAFFSFSASIRLFNHVGFMINVPCLEKDYSTTAMFVAIQLNRAAAYFHTGMRAYYFMVPLVFWLFGAGFLLAGTVLMIVVVHLIDRTPRLHYQYLSTREQGGCR
jgi:uncharacterized membrane protein